jgi:hypothetical protein
VDESDFMKNLFLACLVLSLAPTLAHAMAQRQATASTPFRIEGALAANLKIVSAEIYYQATSQSCISGGSGIFTDGGNNASAQIDFKPALITQADGKYTINADLDPDELANRCKFVFNHLEINVVDQNALKAKLEFYSPASSIMGNPTNLSQAKSITFAPFTFFDRYLSPPQNLTDLGAIDDVSAAAGKAVFENRYTGFVLDVDPRTHPEPFSVDFL